MSLKVVVYLLSFWLMQVSAVIVFAVGGRHRQWELPMFIAGNVVAAVSLIFLMRMYRSLAVTTAYGIATGGAVLLAQLALAIVFKSKLTPGQYFGIGSMVLGIILISLCSPDK